MGFVAEAVMEFRDEMIRPAAVRRHPPDGRTFATHSFTTFLSGSCCAKAKLQPNSTDAMNPANAVARKLVVCRFLNAVGLFIGSHLPNRGCLHEPSLS
jgi:hypothetical protein